MEIKERRKRLLKWFYQKGSKRKRVLLEDFEKDREKYIRVIAQIDIAFEILENNGFFEENERKKFMESNDALCAVEELIFHLDIYDLPRIYVVLLSIDLFDKALDFLTGTLEELNLMDEYYDMNSSNTN